MWEDNVHYYETCILAKELNKERLPQQFDNYI